MIKILANDGIDPIGKKLLEDAGFVVDTANYPTRSTCTSTVKL
jgi:D-3-phosphoglycerate dehydrogenase